MLREAFSHASLILYQLNVDFIRLLGSFLQSRSALAAENLFLRKQLSLYQERQVRPQRATDATRLTMVLVAKLFDWREALITVRPETFIGWHRRGFKLFWRWKSRRIGRPKIPHNLQDLILAMARDNLTWGQARIADELLVKPGIRVSPTSTLASAGISDEVKGDSWRPPSRILAGEDCRLNRVLMLGGRRHSTSASVCSRAAASGIAYANPRSCFGSLWGE